MNSFVHSEIFSLLGHPFDFLLRAMILTLLALMPMLIVSASARMVVVPGLLHSIV